MVSHAGIVLHCNKENSYYTSVCMPAGIYISLSIMYFQIEFSYTVLVKKKGSETYANILRRLTRSVCSRSVHAIHVLTFAKFTKCAQYTVAVRMCISIYTVRELRDNTVVMGLRFCLHEVVAKNHDQFATFF